MSSNKRIALAFTAILVYFAFIFQALLAGPTDVQKKVCRDTCAQRGLSGKAAHRGAFWFQHQASCECTDSFRIGPDGTVSQ